MAFDPQKHRRRTIRLPGYDYSQPGAYFITLVTRSRECLFGEIRDGEMQLSPLGQIAGENWRAIPAHFPNVELGAYNVMPNHLHGILIINSFIASNVGATQCVAPTDAGNTTPAQFIAPSDAGNTTPAQFIAPSGAGNTTPTQCVAPAGTGNTVPRGYPHGPKSGSIGAILGAYKMSVTRRARHEFQGHAMPPPNIWQRNYYERIIRDDREHNNIHLYIAANVDNWTSDDENPNKPT
ncbi:MAG TPA: hypothetical protein VGK00_12030 [Anaerolineales bacterium]|jgi:REP element-mobilizing transposase RayT